MRRVTKAGGRPSKARGKLSTAHAPGVLASCEEFTLYSDDRIEVAPEVERGRWASTMRISNTLNADTRLRLALALLHLAEFTASKELEAVLERQTKQSHAEWSAERKQAESDALKHGPSAVKEAQRRTPSPEQAVSELATFVANKARRDPVALCIELSQTLGPLALQVVNVGPQLVRKKEGCLLDSPKARYDKAIELAADMGAAVKLAGHAMAAWKNSPADKRTADSPSDGGIVWAMQIEAMTVFRETRIRPAKSEIMRRLKEEGWGMWKSKESSDRWRTKFDEAGLGNLPD